MTMRSLILTAPPSIHSFSFSPLPSSNKPLNLFLTQPSYFRISLPSSSSRFIALCSEPSSRGSQSVQEQGSVESENLHTIVGSPRIPSFVSPVVNLSLADQAFFLLAFIACTTSVAFTSLVVAAIPTLFAMRNAATSLSKLADTAREELPSTMAAIRLSGMEISDLTLELSDLSQEIADGVNKSTQALQAAEAGIRQIGSMAHQQTISMIQERASLPVISLQPVVVGAARKTSKAVGRATKTFMNIISRREETIEEYDEGAQ